MSVDVGRQLGPYRLEEKLGGAGLRIVYRATDTLRGQEVALMTMGTSTSDANAHGERVLREARTAAAIDSRHVARVLQLGSTPDGNVYVVMELLRGVPLQRLLAHGARLHVDRAITIARQICHGMQAAHELGIVHRNLKPDHVMLVHDDGEEIAKVLDVGIARHSDDVNVAPITQHDVRVGSLPWMAPEQLVDGVTSTRTDIYAMGLLLFRMLTGAPQWRASNVVELAHQHLHDAPEAPGARAPDAGIPPALDTLVLRCLARDPAQRVPTMKALGKALDDVLRDVQRDVRPANDGDDDGNPATRPMFGSADVITDAGYGARARPPSLSSRPLRVDSKAFPAAAPPTDTAATTATTVRPSSSRASIIGMALLGAVCAASAAALWTATRMTATSNERTHATRTTSHAAATTHAAE